MKAILKKPIHKTVLIQVLAYFMLVVFITLLTSSFFLYSYFSSLFKKDIIDFNQKVLDQLSVFSDEFILNSISELTINLAMLNTNDSYIEGFLSYNDQNKWEAILNMQYDLGKIVLQNRDVIDSIYIYSKDKKVAISQKVIRYIDEQNISSSDEFSWINAISRSTDSMLWLKTHNTKVYDNTITDKGDIITLVSSYPISSVPSKSKGYIAVNIKEDSVHEYLKKFNSSNLGQLFIMDSTGAIISHSNKDNLYRNISSESFVKSILLSDQSNNFMCKFDDQEYFVSYTSSKYNNWYYVSMVPSNLLYQRDYSVKKRVYIISALILFIVLILSNIFSYRIYKPIKKILEKHIPSLNTSNGEKELNEYKLLDSLVNNMSDQIIDLKGTLNENMNIIRHNFFNELLTKCAPNSANIDDVLRSLGITFTNRYYIIVHFTFGKQITESSQSNMQFYKYSIIDHINNLKNSKLLCYPVDTGSEAISVIINSTSNEPYDFKQFVDAVELYCYSNFNFYITTAIGSCQNDLLSIRQSFIDAKKSLQYKFIYPNENIFIFADIANKNLNSIAIPSEFLSKFDQYLKLGSKNEIESTFDQLQSFIVSKSVQYIVVRKLMVSLQDIYKQYLKDIDLDFSNLLTEAEKRLVLHPNNINEYFKNFISIIDHTIEHISNKKQSKNSVIVDSVEQYIMNNLHLDLSLNSAADACGISPQHLSKIFKEERSINFIDHVTRCKIEKAKSLLSTTSQNIEEITASIGYSHSTYFTRKFKQITGSTPSEYRLKQHQAKIKNTNKEGTI